ncbi:MAG: DUF188 domain-containing protein [Vallitaleaceae bacterium]|nr:DUF188 domain-containing protein [Vallitaleaceae bacterium]
MKGSHMVVRVDGDACPVRASILQITNKHKVETIIYTDVNHEFSYETTCVITVDQGIDSVDLAIVRDIKVGDVVITNDYGLASLVLGKKGYAMDANGRAFTLNNIDQLLFERHMHKSLRMMKKKHKGPKKRDRHADVLFRENFEALLLQLKPYS